MNQLFGLQHRRVRPFCAFNQRKFAPVTLVTVLQFQKRLVKVKN